MITIEITSGTQIVKVQDLYSIEHIFTEHSLTGEDLLSAISLFINTKREMEEDNG